MSTRYAIGLVESDDDSRSSQSELDNMLVEYKLSEEDKAKCQSLAHLGYPIDLKSHPVEKRTSVDDLSK